MIVKRKGKKSSPCISPLKALTQPLAFVTYKHSLIQDLHFVLKLFLLSSLFKKTPIHMVVGLFKINFEEHPFLS